jgi:hypothetical protein
MKRSMIALLLVAGCPAPTKNTPVQDAGLPQAPTLTAEQLKQLPGVRRTADGGVILFDVGGKQLTLGEPRHDAIGAAAKCSDLKGACLNATKDLDGCVARLAVCATDRPWEEASPCCAQACITAYQEERRLGASPLQASDAIFGSTHECFPGLQEQYRAAGGTPYLAPRRAVH